MGNEEGKNQLNSSASYTRLKVHTREWYSESCMCPQIAYKTGVIHRFSPYGE